VPGLSIVIPCLGGAAEFDDTLVSVLQNRPADCEVLVVHSQAYDDPYDLGDEVRFIESDGKSLVELLNIAVRAAVGEVLHIVGCGLETSEGWTAPALAHFDDPEIAAVSPVVLGEDRQSVVAAGIRWSLGGARHIVSDRRVVSPGSGRLRAKIIGPTLAAGFYRRDVLVALEGFEATAGDALADASIALAIRSLGRLHVCEPASRLVRLRDPQNIAGGFAAARAAERLFWRYAAERGLPLSLGLHPLAVVGDAIRSGARSSVATSLAGRAAAWLEFGSVQRHRQHLAAAEQRLTELAELRAPIRMPTKRVPPQGEAVVNRKRAA
jgi:hypothetical protein